MLLMAGTSDPIVRVQNTEHMAEKLRAANDWVTVKYYDGLGHMEPVLAMGAMWRWRSTTLADIVDFFTRFGAFPGGGQPRPPSYSPDPPVGQPDMNAIIARLDTMMSPISSNNRRDE